MTNESFIEGVGRELTRLRGLADRALSQVTDDGFFWAPHPEANSPAILVKHLSGNMMNRWSDFLTSDGEGARDRDVEFVITCDDTRVYLDRRWNEAWNTTLRVIGSVDESDLGRVVQIRREPHTVLQAIQRQLVHYAGHVGQLVYVCRLSAGGDWTTLSIPRGKSSEFNARGGTYLAGR